MKSLILPLALVFLPLLNANAKVYTGIGKFSDLGGREWELEWILQCKNGSDKGSISWRKSPAPTSLGKAGVNSPWITGNLIITRAGSKEGGNSIVGFVVDKGYPATLVIHIWEKEPSFVFYDTFMHSEVIVKGLVK